MTPFKEIQSWVQPENLVCRVTFLSAQLTCDMRTRCNVVFYTYLKRWSPRLKLKLYLRPIKKEQNGSLRHTPSLVFFFLVSIFTRMHTQNITITINTFFFWFLRWDTLFCDATIKLTISLLLILLLFWWCLQQNWDHWRFTANCRHSNAFDDVYHLHDES